MLGTCRKYMRYIKVGGITCMETWIFEERNGVKLKDFLFSIRCTLTCKIFCSFQMVIRLNYIVAYMVIFVEGESRLEWTKENSSIDLTNLRLRRSFC